MFSKLVKALSLLVFIVSFISCTEVPNSTSPNITIKQGVEDPPTKSYINRHRCVDPITKLFKECRTPKKDCLDDVVVTADAPNIDELQYLINHCDNNTVDQYFLESNSQSYEKIFEPLSQRILSDLRNKITTLKYSISTDSLCTFYFVMVHDTLAGPDYSQE